MYARLLFTFLLFIVTTPLWAANCTPVALILSQQGKVEVQDGERWRQPDDSGLCPGQTLRVGANSRAVVRLIKEQTNLQLGAMSTIRFAPPEDEQWSVLEVLEGIVHFISRVPQGLKIRTPYVNAAVEGTEFVVEVREGESRISVIEGQVRLNNEAGSEQLAAGQTAVARVGQAPKARLLAAGEGQTLVSWALYYPPVMLPALGAFDGQAAEAVAVHRAGDIDQALALMLAAGDGNAEFHNYRASLLLRRGQIEAAQQDIDRARRADPDNGDSLALQAMVELINNRVAAARQKVAEALAANPRSAVVHLAESHVSQREFRLRDALSSSRLALQLAPDHVLALLRTAELQLMLERPDKALRLLEQAREQAPQLAAVAMLEGFALMMNNHYTAAGAAFDKALGLDDAEPLAHLGRGLVRIRHGDVQGGREALETAASLDPRNALVRSYVAKAYYDEGRYKEAGKQLALAKHMDPNDPTPWLYDAIVKLADDTALAAMDSLQQSIARNDNRAIYRSRLQLDQDQSVRAVNLAQIYRATGNDYGAEREAIRALSRSPDSYSSHRILADIYRDRPGYALAAASEYYQAQLMEPMLMRPVHPQKTETALGVMADLLPGQVSWNDYGGMFAQNDFGGGIDLMAGSDDSRGKSVYLYGLGDHVAFSGGILDYDSEGFRPNNDQAIDLGNVLLKGQYGIVTMQLEARRKRVVKGDMTLNFLDSYSPTLRQESIVDTVDLGVRHAFRNGDNMLLTYREIDSAGSGVFVPGLISIDTELAGKVGEIRYDHHGESFYGLVGARYREDEVVYDNIIIVPQYEEFDWLSQNYYLYAYPSWGPVDLTLGVSYVSIDDSRRPDIKQAWNPKFGFGWAILPNLHLRTAAFRVLQRSITDFDSPDPSLEPVSVQGFAQELLVITATDIKTLGLALDWQVGSALAFGFQAQYSELDEPIVSLTGGTYNYDNWQSQERTMDVHIWWRGGSRWTLSSALVKEILDADSGDFTCSGSCDRLDTTRLPVELTVFPAPRLNAIAKLTAVHQEGRFDDGLGGLVKGQDNFWLLDLKAAWSFPGGRGALVLAVNNALDSSFHYQQPSHGNPTMMPTRHWSVKLEYPF